MSTLQFSIGNINFYKGDVIDAFLEDKNNNPDDPVYLLHQVNCQGAFGGGVAGEILRRIPSAAQEYRTICRYQTNSAKLLGTALTTESGVVHIFSQYGYGGDTVHTDYPKMRAALESFMSYQIASHPYRIYLPNLIGCGLANGNPNQVLAVIAHSLLKAESVNIYGL